MNKDVDSMLEGMNRKVEDKDEEEEYNDNNILVEEEKKQDDLSQMFKPFETQDIKQVVQKQTSKTVEKGCGPADTDEEEKQIDMNLSGDTSEEVDKVINKTYVNLKVDRLIRDADDGNQDMGEEFKLDDINGRRSAELSDDP